MDGRSDNTPRETAVLAVDVVSLETTTGLAVGALVAVAPFAGGWLDRRRRDDRAAV
jgi:hypothetical protein